MDKSVFAFQLEDWSENYMEQDEENLVCCACGCPLLPDEGDQIGEDEYLCEDCYE